MIGQTISHYKILEKLGQGGMGVVYRAHDTKLDRDVALKFLPADLTRDTEARERFVHEARAASALDHPNICTIHEIHEADDGRSFIVMACYDGETLKQRIGRGPLKVEEAVELAGQIARGLQKAHEQGITHRDIKPGNIILTRDGVAKIVDFGLAKLRGQTKLTKEGSTVGTVEYMSPEQARGEDVDHRTDIWSLGCVLYEMLCGRSPFRADYDQAIIYSILNTTQPPLTSLRVGVPIELERIVNRCLEKNPGERYQSALELLADLTEPDGQRPETAAVSWQKGETPGPAKRQPRKTWLLILLFVIAVGVSGLLIFKLSSGTSGPTTRSVAVLPFRNISDSTGEEYFSDGLTEDIITQLSKISAIDIVSPRVSVMRFKGTDRSVQEIAGELGVATILDGSVRRSGDHLRVAAQLTDASTGRTIWAETYDRDMTQIFLIQSDLAQQIAAVLKAKLLPAEKMLIENRPTGSTTAYEYYLRGRNYYNNRSGENNERAIEYFKKALEADPTYALAYAGLGDSYVMRVGYGYPRAWRDSSIAMSRKALSIDSNLAEGYKALGLAYTGNGWQRRALEMYQKAVSINPGYYPAVSNIGYLLSHLGRIDEAMKWNRRVLELKPRHYIALDNIGSGYRILGEDEKALEYFNQALTEQPGSDDVICDIGEVLLLKGNYRGAIEQAEKSLSLHPDNHRGLALAGSAEHQQGRYREAEQYYRRMGGTDPADQQIALGDVFWKTGRKAQALEILNANVQYYEKRLLEGSEWWGEYYSLVTSHAIQGDTTKAIVWMRRLINTGWVDYRSALSDPCMANLRSNDTFRWLLAEVKTRVDEMRKQVDSADWSRK